MFLLPSFRHAFAPMTVPPTARSPRRGGVLPGRRAGRGSPSCLPQSPSTSLWPKGPRSSRNSPGTCASDTYNWGACANYWQSRRAAVGRLARSCSTRVQAAGSLLLNSEVLSSMPRGGSPGLPRRGDEIIGPRRTNYEAVRGLGSAGRLGGVRGGALWAGGGAGRVGGGGGGGRWAIFWVG